jgi:RNA polymerase sigma factor (sigma-70 family)
MPSATVRAVSEPFQSLFGTGTCVGHSDGQLLARFIAGRDDAGELAFEALVKRHGPMVQNVCRQMLDDPSDIHDSFQAVFLVLARRASAIRSRDSVASWLHGVAARVAARARVATVRRGIRDRRTAKAAQARAVATLDATLVDSCPVERKERAGLIHREISRLPEKYRAPIVLCYMEGLTHDEAAASLSWPVGTVRSRLSRGRDTLRRRLSRRGLTAPAVLGPLAAWLAGDQRASAATASMVSGDLLAPVMKLVSQTESGRGAVALSSQPNVLALADGVLKMFLLKKLSIAMALVLSLATLTIGGGIAIVRTSSAQDAQAKPTASAATKPSFGGAQAKPASPVPVDADTRRLIKQRELAAVDRYEFQYSTYQKGRITIDRLIEASDQLEKILLQSTRDPAQRMQIRKEALERLVGIEKREDTEMRAGRSTIADLSEIRLRRIQAEIDLKNAENEDTSPAALLERMKQLERRLLELEKRVPAPLGRM